MIETPSAQPLNNGVTRPNWSAVFAVAFCVACLIIVEFLPVSLLTPMVQDLGISEGVAGQAVTATAFVAMFVRSEACLVGKECQSRLSRDN